MLATYILGALSVVFLSLSVARVARSGPRHPQARTWLLLGGIFGAVAVYLLVQQA